MFSAMIEIGVILLFILNIYLAKKTKKLDLLIISTIFAALFENLHVILFQDYAGGYYYSAEFLILVYKTPLFVILSWGIIILNAYLIATRLTNKVARIFLIPILAVMVDFALEFFAVRQGYWTWVGYNETQGLFGVPASNFIAWMLVTLAIVFIYDQLKERWMVPIAAYILFVFMSAGLYFTIQFLKLGANEQVYIVWALIALLAALTLVFWNIKGKEEINNKYLAIASISRVSYYVFSAVLIISNTEFAKSIWPILAYVYLVEAGILVAPYYKKRKINITSSFSS